MKYKITHSQLVFIFRNQTKISIYFFCMEDGSHLQFSFPKISF